MTSTTERFFIQEADGTRRRIEASSFPLVIGGAHADIAVSGTTLAPLAHLGLSDGEVFVQPGNGRVSCNGTTVASSQWLRDGDILVVGTLRIEIEAGDSSIRFCLSKEREKATDPPVVAARGRAQTPIVPPRGETVKPIAFTPKPLEPAKRSPRHLGVGALIFWGAVVVLAGAAWAVFSARLVAIDIEPEPQSVVVEGGPFVLDLGGRFLMHRGSYTVIAEKDGYRRLEASIEVGDARSATFELAMQLLPGRLAITTDPTEGAVVSIDGATVGTSPLEPIELEPGEHQVHIQASGYRDFQAEVVVEGAGTLVNLEASLEPRWAPVTFSSDPPGARIRVAGKQHGTTPATANVIEGTHEYEVVLNGYKPFRGRVHVVAGQPQTLASIPLSPREGTITLASVPGSANVTVNGEYRGQTPLELDLAPGRTYQLEVSRAGYDSLTRDVAVESDPLTPKWPRAELNALRLRNVRPSSADAMKTDGKRASDDEGRIRISENAVA